MKTRIAVREVCVGDGGRSVARDAFLRTDERPLRTQVVDETRYTRHDVKLIDGSSSDSNSSSIDSFNQSRYVVTSQDAFFVVQEAAIAEE